MWYVNYKIHGVSKSICFYDDEMQARHFAELVNGTAYME